MKAHALTLHWHTDNQPIYSANFQPTAAANGRLATAAGDNNVRIWRVDLTSEGLFPRVTYLSTLTKHTQAVNVVRFDYHGSTLASAGDDGNVILWQLATDVDSSRGFGDDPDAPVDRETWRIKHLCRSSMAEIYDLAWSPDSQYLIAGSMDNVARIYSASTGLCIRQIAEHSHYVQGVAWDPLNEYVATQSSDRTIHIYTLKSKDGQFSLSTHHKISKAELPVSLRHAIDVDLPPPTHHLTSASTAPTFSSQTADSPTASTPGTPSSISLPMNPPVSTHSRRSSFGNSPSIRRSPSPSPALPLPAVRPLDSPKLGYRMVQLYQNEGLTSFFRRLTFSPDGSLLLTPAGQYKISTATGIEETSNTVYIYTRAGLNKPPVVYLPALKKPAIVVKCSSVRYRLREGLRGTQHITIDSSSVDGLEISSLSESQEHKECPPTSAPAHIPPTGSGKQQAFSLPYRIVYAVATQDSVYIYDTQQSLPLCVVSNLHYATFTDLTWSVDGRILFMTSTDGFSSVVVFEDGELGEKYEEAESNYTPAQSLDSEVRDIADYYSPTPVSIDDQDGDMPTSDTERTPIISPVPQIANSFTNEQTQKRSAENDVSGTSKKPKKPKRIAPVLVGEVRRS
ncbi:WD40-repeat-containing domain protein [Lipomyces arxii]|uniref:WD40-repeat-containing domain protein n=1 Tax=Lipomyces arxii TaxID=56418 RepID=UPI0034CD5734